MKPKSPADHDRSTGLVSARRASASGGTVGVPPDGRLTCCPVLAGDPSPTAVVAEEERVVDPPVPVVVDELGDIHPVHGHYKHQSVSAGIDPVATHRPSQPGASTGLTDLAHRFLAQHPTQFTLVQAAVEAIPMADEDGRATVVEADADP